MRTTKLFLCFLLWGISTVFAQSNGIFQDGNCYKLAVEQDGIYRIDRDFLLKNGIDVNNINPQNIRIFGGLSGILPQENSAVVALEPQELAIWVQGEQDGRFDANDFVLFYAQAPDKIDVQDQQFVRQRSIYEQKNYYFFQIGTQKGKRISQQSSLAGGNLVEIADDFVFHELDKRNIIDSGRDWYGEMFDLQNQQNFEFDVQGIVPQSRLSVRSSVLGIGDQISFFYVSLNGQELGRHRLGALPTDIYGPKGVPDQQVFTTQAPNTDKISLQLRFDKQESRISFGHLNFLEIHFQRRIGIYKGQSIFRSFASQKNTLSQFAVEGNANMQIWDISQAQNPVQQQFVMQNNKATFGANTLNVLKTYIAFDGTRFLVPNFVKAIAQQNIKALPSADLLIVCNPNFLTQAQRLADFRRKNDQLSVQVLTTEQIYNEFSSGKMDISAIRNCVKFFYEKDKKLKYLLLFGDASYDYLEIQNPNKHYIVPSYESRESLHPVASYVSDDYFGFLENHEGRWGEAFNDKSQEHSLEIGIGRLPVRTAADAKAVVDKLITYTQPIALGAWRNKLSFVADDGDFNIHFNDAESLIGQIENDKKNYNFEKLYVDAFPRTLEAGGQRSPIVREKILSTLEKGTLLMSYIGHGSERAWAEEEILTLASIERLNNPNRLPILLTATCEFGRFDNDPSQSGAERAITNPNGGAIGVFTATRPAYAFTNFILSRAFFNHIFEDKNQRIGDIIRKTKNNSIDGINNRNFTFLGDPSLKLAYPKGNIKISSIKDQDGRENVLGAMSKVTVEGEVHDNQLLSNFNGQLDILIYDKKTEKLTLGLGSASLKARFEDYQHVIFRGKASVRNGRFKFSFVVPKHIDYRQGLARINLYAADSTQNIDADGYAQIPTGTTANNLPKDNTPPKIRLFMDNENFVSGATVKPNTTLLATISDENGISYTGAGLGHDIEAQLNGESIILNDFFYNQLDDYTTGKLSYPFRNLAEGKYQLRLRAWDNFNNSTQESIEFVVRKDNFALQSNCFPNPFNQKTEIVFQHNRPNEHLYINVYIYSANGQLVRYMNSESFNSLPQVRQIAWDGTNDYGTKVANGVYLYRLQVQTDANETAHTTGKIVFVD